MIEYQEVCELDDSAWKKGQLCSLSNASFLANHVSELMTRRYKSCLVTESLYCSDPENYSLTFSYQLDVDVRNRTEASATVGSIHKVCRVRYSEPQI